MVSDSLTRSEAITTKRHRLKSAVFTRRTSQKLHFNVPFMAKIDNFILLTIGKNLPTVGKSIPIVGNIIQTEFY